MLFAGVLHSMHCVSWFFARRNGQSPEESCCLRRAVYDTQFNIRESSAVAVGHRYMGFVAGCHS